MTQASLLDRLASLDTNTVSDALDFLSLPGATFGLRPLWDCPKIVGRASTIQLGPKTDAAPTVHLIERWLRGNAAQGWKPARVATRSALPGRLIIANARLNHFATASAFLRHPA